METFGYPLEVWMAARAQIHTVLVERARRSATISYSELIQRVPAIALEARDARLDELLRQIATDEYAAHRGMLSVLVVHKTGDQRPGRGFYECARSLGLDTSDEDRLWIEQFSKVVSSW